MIYVDLNKIMTNIYCTIKNAERKALKTNKAKKEAEQKKENKTEIVSCKKSIK